jgi:hypothetical protein
MARRLETFDEREERHSAGRVEVESVRRRAGRGATAFSWLAEPKLALRASRVREGW